MASLLLGYPASGQLDWADNPYRTRPYVGVYVQDDWKLSSRLTVNLGMRYDVQYAWRERFNRSNRGFDLSAKNPLSDAVLANWARIKADYDKTNPKYPYPAPPAQLSGGWRFAGVDGRPERIFDTDWTNLAPRFGLAWRIAKGTVLRTGGGVYYMANTQGGRASGFSITTNYTPSQDGKTPSAGASLTGRGVTFDPDRIKTPRTYQYSLGLQQQLPHNIAAEISFAGNYQTYASGYPVGWPNLNNKCGEWHAKTQNRYSWFNNDKSCYENFPSFNLRTIPDRFPDIRQHAAPQLNIALEKTTRIGERMRFMIRAEAFNLTNTTIYGGVETSFTSTRFGMLPQDQQNWPRIVQLAAKVFF